MSISTIRLRIVKVEWLDEGCITARLIRRDRWFFWRRYEAFVYYEDPDWYYVYDRQKIEGDVERYSNISTWLKEQRITELDRLKSLKECAYHKSMWSPLKTFSRLPLARLLGKNEDG